MSPGEAQKANFLDSPRPAVALVSDAILPYHFGGKESYYHELARRLAKSLDIQLFTMKWWDGPSTREADGIKHIAICPRVPLYTKSGKRSIWQAVVFAVSCFRLLSHRFDVIVADHIPYLQLLVLRVVATIRRRKLVVVWHEVWGAEYWIRYAGAVGVVGAWMEKIGMTLPDHVISVSAHTAGRLRPLLQKDMPLTVATMGIDLDFISNIKTFGQHCDLLVVGRLISHKRIDLLLDALSTLHARGRRLTLRVIGDGPEREALHAQVNTLRLQDWVEFSHDVATQAAIYSLMKAARVFVFPSEREGLGIVVLEAFACGLPVVTTSAPDNLSQYLVARSNRGYICPPTTDALSSTIEKALDSHFSEAAVEASTIRNKSTAHEPWLVEYDWHNTTRIVAEILAANASALS